MHGVAAARKLQIGVFPHGERVHIAPEQDRRPSAVGAENRHNTRGGGVEVKVQGKTVEGCQDPLPGLGELQSDLRLLVERPAESNRLG